MRFHRYRTNGVSKVVNLLDSSSGCTCQYPFRASTFVNTFARETSVSTSSIIGRGYLSLFKALCSCLGSRQRRRSPDSFVAITRLLTQSLGSSTGISTPMSVSLSNFVFNYGLMANGTRREGDTLGRTVGSTGRCCFP